MMPPQDECQGAAPSLETPRGIQMSVGSRRSLEPTPAHSLYVFQSLLLGQGLRLLACLLRKLLTSGFLQ